jgi:hypothetical protein
VACTFTKPELIGQRIGQASLLSQAMNLPESLLRPQARRSEYSASHGALLTLVFREPTSWRKCLKFWIRTIEDFQKSRDLPAQTKIMDGTRLTDQLDTKDLSSQWD